MFDPYLTSSHPLVKVVVDNLAGSYGLFWGPKTADRERQMKARDKANLHAMLSALFANLAMAAYLGIKPPSVGVSLRAGRLGKARYNRAGFSGLAELLVKLYDAGAGVLFTRSEQKGMASTVALGPPLADELCRFKLRPEHFGQAEGRETISLSRSARDYVAGTVERETLDYVDTPETIRYRAEMATINAAIRKADLRMVADGGPLVATSIRDLRRCFNLPPDAPEGKQRFDLGGRLFGGWWGNLAKDRRHAIRIEGEPIADLDFRAMFVRLAYLEAGVTPPGDNEDLYAFPGFSEADQREGIKKTVLAMLFRTTPLVRLPQDARDLLPPRTTAAQVRKAILTAHPALANVFETGIGLRLMFLESQILVAALLKLESQGIVALPMHDGLMCAKSKAALVKLAMEDAAEEIVGYRLPIARKTQRNLRKLRPT